MTRHDDNVILDTNVLVHIARRKAAGRYLRGHYRLDHLDYPPMISVVTVGECYSLAEAGNWGPQKRETLSKWLTKLQIIDVFSESILQAYARIDVTSRRLGRPMSKNDLWIAAMAMTHEAVLLTLDGDFLHLHPELVRVEHCRSDDLPKGP